MTTPEARNLRLHTLARFIDWPVNFLYFGLHTFTFLCSFNSIFVKYIVKMNTLSTFINMNKYIADFVDIGEYTDRTGVRPPLEGRAEVIGEIFPLPRSGRLRSSADAALPPLASRCIGNNTYSTAKTESTIP